MISQREIVNMKLVIRWGCQASKQARPSLAPGPNCGRHCFNLSFSSVHNVHCVLHCAQCTMYTVKREAKSNFTIIINTRSQPWSLSCSEVNSCFKSNSDFGHCCNHPPGGFPPFQKIMNFSTHFFRNTTL